MLLILDPDTPGAFITSIDCRIASSSATHDDILAVIESTKAANSAQQVREVDEIRYLASSRSSMCSI